MIIPRISSVRFSVSLKNVTKYIVTAFLKNFYRVQYTKSILKVSINVRVRTHNLGLNIAVAQNMMHPIFSWEKRMLQHYDPFYFRLAILVIDAVSFHVIYASILVIFSMH